MVAARVVRRTGRRAQAEAEAEAEAEVRLADGTVTAQARALLTRPPPEVSGAWEPERKHWRVDEE